MAGSPKKKTSKPKTGAGGIGGAPTANGAPASTRGVTDDRTRAGRAGGADGAPKAREASASTRGEIGDKTAGGADDKKRIARMIEVLAAEFPDAHCMLDHRSAFELLIATILAAQCTDAMVNTVTPALFAKYPTPRAFIDAPQEELEQAIFKTGFYRNKSKSIKKCCAALVEKHGGEVPSTMEELVALGGVGRKTANCVLGVSYGIPGIVVDTHVKRLSKRMGFTEETNPDKIESALAAIAPEKEWTHMSHLFADLGRSYCAARKPQCGDCPVNHLCPKNLD